MKISIKFMLFVLFLIQSVSSVMATQSSEDNASVANKSKNLSGQEKTFVEYARLILSNLDKTKNQGSGFDYWPDGGIRIVYDHLRTFMNYRDLVKLAPMPVFTNNHHTKIGLDLISNTSFGHYNPAFLDWVRDRLAVSLKSPEFISQTKPLFKTYLAKTALTYWETYLTLEKWPDERDAILKDYRDKIEQGKLTAGYYYGIAWNGEKKFKSMNYLSSKYNVNVVSPAVYFWMRRKLDNTDVKMKALLGQLLKAYGQIE